MGSFEALECFNKGKHFLDIGNYTSAKSVFEEGIKARGLKPYGFDKRRDNFGTIFQDEYAAKNYWGLSLALYNEAILLAKYAGVTDEVRELVKSSEEVFIESRALDTSLVAIDNEGAIVLSRKYDFLKGLEDSLAKRESLMCISPQMTEEMVSHIIEQNV